ncbi:6474_t:CDS:1, partial [Cetraspora pellucida]
ILQAWNNIDPNLIRKAFKCCDISNSQDGTEDSLIFDYNRLGQYTNSHNHMYMQN